MLLTVVWWLLLGVAKAFQSDFAEAKRATVLSVSAMCGLGGITVSIEFDRPFMGKIYSMEYANVHECIYYNAQDMRNVLFTIPLHRCGTRVTRNTREIIDTVENRVYVQMDKFAQTAQDRQYSFLCELVHSKALLGITGNDGADIRRSPSRLTATGNVPIVPGPPISPQLPVYQNTFPLPAPNPNSFQRNGENPHLLQPLPLTPATFNAQTPRSIVPNQVNFQRQPQQQQQPWMTHESALLQPVSAGSFAAPRLIGNSIIPSKVTGGQNATPSATPPPIVPAQPAAGANSVVEEEQVHKQESLHNHGFTKKVPVYSATEPVRIYATQEINQTDLLSNVFMEIQEGEGPRAAVVSKPVKIGDRLTLVIKSTDAPKDQTQYNIFVHSCFASDGPGSTKIVLVDKAGCSVSQQVVGAMKRERDAANIVYYFQISAFKFPGPNDVYFSCAVDISPSYHFPELCQSNPTSQIKTVSKRELITARVDSVALFNGIKVNLPEAEGNGSDTVNENLPLKAVTSTSDYVCLSMVGMRLLVATLVVLIFTLCLSFTASVLLFRKVRRLRAK